MIQQRISDDELKALIPMLDALSGNAHRTAHDLGPDAVRDLADARALLVQKDAEIAALKAPNPVNAAIAEVMQANFQRVGLLEATLRQHGIKVPEFDARTPEEASGGSHD